MQFVSVRDLRGKSAQIWKWLLKKKEMVITSNGKPIAILSSASEDNLEESMAAIRSARAMAAVNSMQVDSAKAGRDRLTLDEINSEINAQRKERSK